MTRRWWAPAVAAFGAAIVLVPAVGAGATTATTTAGWPVYTDPVARGVAMSLLPCLDRNADGSAGFCDGVRPMAGTSANGGTGNTPGDPATSQDGRQWGWVAQKLSSGQVNFSFALTGANTSDSRLSGPMSGPICVGDENGAGWVGTASTEGDGVYRWPNGGGYTLGKGPYFWRPTVAAISSGGMNSGACQGANLVGPPASDTIQTPEVDCTTEYVGEPATAVRIRARVGNPQVGATDVVTVQAPWAAAQTTYRGEFELPPLATMPLDGWVGTCRVKRTVNTTKYRTSTQWKDQPGGPNMVDDVPPEETATKPRRNEVITMTPNATGRYIYIPDGNPGGGIARIPNTPTVPVAPPTGPGAPAGGLSIPAAAATGWLLGGAATGVFGEVTGWNGDDEWFCKWNPGYRGKRQEYCADISADSLRLRNQVQLKDSGGTVVTEVSTVPWQTAEAIAEVNINPTKPDVGIRTTTGVTQPAEAFNPARQESLQDVLAPGPGEERATGQQDQTSTGTNTTVDTREGNTVPAPAAPGSGTCHRSFWSSLNPANIAESIGCVLRRLFVPAPGVMQQETEKLKEKASGTPVGLLVGVVGGLVTGLTGGGGGGLNGPPCGPVIGWTAAATSGKVPGFQVRLPSPSPCAGNGEDGGRSAMDEKAADLIGFRSLVRGLMSLAIVWVVVWSFLRAAPWAGSSTEAAPDGGRA